MDDDYHMHGQFFHDSEVPMYIFDIGTLDIIAVNNAAIIQYEYSKDEFLALTAVDIMDVENSTQLNQNANEHNSTPYDYGKWKHYRKSGEYFFVHIYSYGISLNGKNAKLVMAINVPE